MPVIRHCNNYRHDPSATYFWSGALVPRRFYPDADQVGAE